MNKEKKIPAPLTNDITDKIDKETAIEEHVSTLIYLYQFCSGSNWWHFQSLCISLMLMEKPLVSFEQHMMVYRLSVLFSKFAMYPSCPPSVCSVT